MLTEARYINALRNCPDRVAEYLEGLLSDSQRAALEAVLIPPPTDEEARAELLKLKDELKRHGVAPTVASAVDLKVAEVEARIKEKEKDASGAEITKEAGQKSKGLK